MLERLTTASFSVSNHAEKNSIAGGEKDNSLPHIDRHQPISVCRTLQTGAQFLDSDTAGRYSKDQLAKNLRNRTEVVMDSPTSIPRVTVSFPGALRAKIGNRISVTVCGCTIREVIAALDHDFPGLRFNLCHETGEVRPFVNIFLERENIRYLQGLDTPVSAGARIHILQSVAGG